MARVQLAVVGLGWVLAVCGALRSGMRRRRDRRVMAALQTLATLPRQRTPQPAGRQRVAGDVDRQLASR